MVELNIRIIGDTFEQALQQLIGSSGTVQVPRAAQPEAASGVAEVEEVEEVEEADIVTEEVPAAQTPAPSTAAVDLPKRRGRRPKNAEQAAESIGQQSLPTNDAPPQPALDLPTQQERNQGDAASDAAESFAQPAATQPVASLDVYAAGKAFAMKHGTAAFVKKLAAFGAKRVGDIAAEKVAEFVASLETA